MSLGIISVAIVIHLTTAKMNIMTLGDNNNTIFAKLAKFQLQKHSTARTYKCIYAQHESL